MTTDSEALVHELANRFGLLNYFSLSTIYTKWSQYSASLSATWMEPTKQSVEHVFQVELEEDANKST